MTIDIRQLGIDPNQSADRSLMEQLQGNILRSHGYRYTTCMLGEFVGAETTSVSNKFADLMATRISNEWSVHVRRSKVGRNSTTADDHSCFVGCYLSKHGYDFLDWKYHEPGIFPSANVDKVPVHRTPNHKQLWFDDAQKNRDIDFMILIAHNEETAIAHAMKDIQTDFEKNGVAKIIGTITGEQFSSKHQPSRDPFGFQDSLNQPQFYQRISSQKSYLDEPLSPLNLVIREDVDPLGPGSFLAVHHYLTNARLLRQDYPDDEDQAMIMGRDLEGNRISKCPHSHVSRMIGSDTEEGKSNRPKIVRRGFVFPANLQEKQGLFFMSFQASIQEQFERLLYWANQIQVHDYPNNKVRCDELIGQNHEFGIIPRYVTFLGGGYFFAPPIARFRPPCSNK